MDSLQWNRLLLMSKIYDRIAYIFNTHRETQPKWYYWSRIWETITIFIRKRERENITGDLIFCHLIHPQAQWDIKLFFSKIIVNRATVNWILDICLNTHERKMEQSETKNRGCIKEQIYHILKFYISAQPIKYNIPVGLILFNMIFI